MDIISWMSGKKDHELLAEFVRSESETAFSELVQRHIALVYSTALRHANNPHHAEEITQVVFVILARKAAALSSRVVLSGWLYQTARLTAANFVKREIRRVRREQEVYMQSTLPEQERIEWERIAPLLDEAMGALGETDRNAVVLRFFENRTAVEIGAALCVPEETARKRVNRALEKLRRFLFKRGVDSTTAALAETISANSIQAAPAALAKSVTAVALANGATASSSTLTFIKGALKIMAWTKAKIAIVVGAVVLVAVGTTTVTVKEVESSRANAIFEQIWAHPVGNVRFNTMDALIHAPPALIVRPTHYPTVPSEGFWTDARVGHGFLVNADVKQLVDVAYDSAPWRTVLPTNMPGGGFDLMETLPAGQNESALQKEIQRQFGLVTHSEMREADVLRLAVNDSERLNLHVSVGGQPSVYANGAFNKLMNFVFKNQTLKDVAFHLENYFETPLTGVSGLGGHYDFTFNVDYKLEPKDLRQSLCDQLDQFGLELVPTNMPIEMLVVEKSK